MGILRRLWRRIDAYLEADLHKWRDVDCPHSPEDPCEPCQNRAWAERW